MSQQSMGMNYQFDARQYDPSQGTPAHPVGKYPATIINTGIKPTKNQDGGMFEVTFKTAVGEISTRYNLWNTNDKAVDIAHRQLSALCHAINIFNVDMNNGGAAIRGGQCQIEVGLQKGEETYTEIKKVFDAAGNEPGKGGQQAQPQQQAFNQAPQQQPQQGFAQPNPNAGFAQPQEQQQPQGNAWGGQPQQDQQPQAAPAAPAWGQGQQQTQQAPQQQAAPAWNQNQAAPAPGGNAPWGGQR